MSGAATKTGKPRPRPKLSSAEPLASPKEAAPPTLAEIQDRFQQAVLKGDEGIFDTILDNSRTTRQTLFGVYANAYVGRLVDILQNEYELLYAYCGDEEFRKLAEAYIAACPSHTQNARWFGSHLPEHLAAAAPYSNYPELSELSAIERATSNAFDAEDAPLLEMSALQAYAPESWPQLVFKPHPSAVRLDLATNAFHIWKALKSDEAPPAAETSKGVNRLVVWRQGSTPKLRIMPDEEAMMWIEATKGVRFEVLCEMVATFDDPDTAAMRAAGYLQGWLAAEMLTSASISEPARRSKVASSRERAK